jgi:hypothetical protein
MLQYTIFTPRCEDWKKWPELREQRVTLGETERGSWGRGAAPPSPGPGSPAPGGGQVGTGRWRRTCICSSAVDTCCIVEQVEVRQVEEDRLLLCCCWELLLVTCCLRPDCCLRTCPPPPPLPKGMHGLADGSARLPPARIPAPLMSEVEARRSFQLPLGCSLLSEPALLPATPLDTLRLPELRYMLPSLLPTA